MCGEQEYINNDCELTRLLVSIELVYSSVCLLYKHCGGYTDVVQMDNVGDVLRFAIYVKEAHVDEVVYTNNCDAHMDSFYTGTFFGLVSRLTDVDFISNDDAYCRARIMGALRCREL